MKMLSSLKMKKSAKAYELFSLRRARAIPVRISGHPSVVEDLIEGMQAYLPHTKPAPALPWRPAAAWHSRAPLRYRRGATKIRWATICGCPTARSVSRSTLPASPLSLRILNFTSQLRRKVQWAAAQLHPALGEYVQGHDCRAAQRVGLSKY